MMMMMMKGCLADSTDASIFCEEGVCGSLQKEMGWRKEGREREMEREKSGKEPENEIQEKRKKDKNERQERNTIACRAPTRRDAATPSPRLDDPASI